MKNEDAFNAYLSKKFRALPGTAALKMAEKYHVGIPDFCLWRGGRSVVVESKFVQSVQMAGALLKHPFTGPQLSFMKTLMLSGTPAFGLIGCNDSYKMWALPYQVIPESGNWAPTNFVALTYSDSVYEFDIREVEALAAHLFSYHVEGRQCLR